MKNYSFLLMALLSIHSNAFAESAGSSKITARPIVGGGPQAAQKICYIKLEPCASAPARMCYQAYYTATNVFIAGINGPQGTPSNTPADLVALLNRMGVCHGSIRLP